VYVDYYDDDFQAIAFETVSTFKVVAAGGSSLTNLTAIGTGTATTDFDPTADIVIEFDRPIATVNKAQMRYHDGPEYYGTTASADTATGLSPDKKVLTIRPTNLLAPSAEFVVRLNVTSEDGQQIVYDSTNDGNPSAWANYTNAASIADLQIEVAAGDRFVGISKQAASGGTLRPEPNAAVAKTNTTVDLHFVAPSVNFDQGYDIYVRRHDLWNTTPVRAGVLVDAGETEIQGGGNAITAVGIPGATPHVTAESVQYRARGVNYNGYVVEATANITFAP
jgi:hypothetical protein